MRKFKEEEIIGAQKFGDMSWVWEVMQNQNEIIDWIEKSHPKSYQEWAKEQIDDSKRG